MGFHSKTTTQLTLTSGGDIVMAEVDENGSLVITVTTTNNQAAQYIETTKSDAEAFAAALVTLVNSMM